MIGSAHSPASDPCPAPGTGAPGEGTGRDPHHPAAPGSAAEEEEGEGGLVPAGGVPGQAGTRAGPGGIQGLSVGQPPGGKQRPGAWQRGRGRLRGEPGPPALSPRPRTRCRHHAGPLGQRRQELLGSLVRGWREGGGGCTVGASWRSPPWGHGPHILCQAPGGGASGSFAPEPGAAKPPGSRGGPGGARWHPGLRRGLVAAVKPRGRRSSSRQNGL